MQYLFKNICNYDGDISVESLGKALVKHKIEFKLWELQEMMAICKEAGVGDPGSHNFENDGICEEIKNMAINY
jgi:hypothetical protein